MTKSLRSPDFSRNGGHSLTVGPLEIHDPVIVEYLQRFQEGGHEEQLLHAAHLGVLAIRQASPTLDTKVVEAKFSEIEEKLNEHLGDFKEEIGNYLNDKDGVLPKTLDDFFNPKGKLADVLAKWLGPNSKFAKDIDPRNTDGILTRIEKKVGALVDARLEGITNEFSLDEKDSAMARLKGMIEKWHGDIKTTLGNLQGRKQEADKGHIKGNNFQEDLYARLAEWSVQMGDEPKFVHGTPGADGRCKTGDHVVALGDTTACPGTKIVVEAKDQPSTKVKLRDGLAELQQAKENREATVGIFVFSKGSEPPELRGDFLKVGDDFLCTADKDELEAGGPLLCFQYAYKIARAVVVAKSVTQNGSLDLHVAVQDLDAMAKDVTTIEKLVSQAGTIERNGKNIKEALGILRQNLDDRIQNVLATIKDAPINSDVVK